jgi:hypothetical protein
LKSSQSTNNWHRKSAVCQPWRAGERGRGMRATMQQPKPDLLPPQARPSFPMT